MIDRAAGLEAGETITDERRNKARHPYDALVAMVLCDGDGGRSKPQVLQAKDISVGGICLVSRHMMHPGAIGALQLARSDGNVALVGIQVMHCRYVGEMLHQTGLQFIAMPEGLTRDDFLSHEGAMPLLDPNITDQCAAAKDAKE